MLHIISLCRFNSRKHPISLKRGETSVVHPTTFLAKNEKRKCSLTIHSIMTLPRHPKHWSLLTNCIHYSGFSFKIQFPDFPSICLLLKTLVQPPSTMPRLGSISNSIPSLICWALSSLAPILLYSPFSTDLPSLHHSSVSSHPPHRFPQLGS